MITRRWMLTGVMVALLVLALTSYGVQSGNPSFTLQGQWVGGSELSVSQKWALTSTTGESLDPIPLQGDRYTLESGFPIQTACQGYRLFLPVIGR